MLMGGSEMALKAIEMVKNSLLWGLCLILDVPLLYPSILNIVPPHHYHQYCCPRYHYHHCQRQHGLYSSTTSTTSTRKCRSDMPCPF
jgi:hypothetical protein